MVVVQGQQSPARPRARELGIAPGAMETGPLNAITDVGGVLVGHATIVQGDTVRTGVTAVLPHGGNLFREKVPGARVRGQRLRQARRLDAGRGARHDRVADCADQHLVGRDRGGRRRAMVDRAAGQRERAIGQRARRRNQRRRAERHPRISRHARPRDGPRSRPPGPARSRKGPSAPARGRSRSAGKAASAPRRAASVSRTTRGPSASSCRPTTAAAWSSTACRCGKDCPRGRPRRPRPTGPA